MNPPVSEGVSPTGSPQERPTFCRAVVSIEFEDGTFEEVRCSDRYEHAEAHSTKIWWSS